MNEFQHRLSAVIRSAEGIPSEMQERWYEPLAVRFEGEGVAPFVVEFEDGFDKAFEEASAQLRAFAESNLRTQLIRYNPQQRTPKALVVRMTLKVLQE